MREIAVTGAGYPSRLASAGAAALRDPQRIHDPDGSGKFYLGREIALVMGHEAAGWLERPEREKEEEAEEAAETARRQGRLDRRRRRRRQRLPHASAWRRMVGDEGQSLAVDIQQEMLDLINAKAKKEKVTNIETVLGTEQRPEAAEGEGRSDPPRRRLPRVLAPVRDDRRRWWRR